MARRIYSRINTGIANKRVTDPLKNESDRLLQDFRNRLAREIFHQTGITNARSGSNNEDNFSGDGVVGSDLTDFSLLMTAAARYLLRPTLKMSTQESSRSQAAQQQFRLSQSQAAAQAAAALAKGQKNS